MIIFCSVLLIRRTVSDKHCRENENTHFSNFFFFFQKSCCLWDNVEKYGTARQTTDINITCACWITKATNTHTHTHTHTHNMRYLLLFHSNKVTHVHQNVTLHVPCLSCYELWFRCRIYALIIYCTTKAICMVAFYVYGSMHHNIFYEITNRCSYMQSILFRR